MTEANLRRLVFRAVRIWDIDSDVSASRTFKSYDIEHTATSTVKSVAFCKNHKLLATGSTDFEVKVWDVSFIWDVEKEASGGKKDTSELEATNENTEPEEGKPVSNTENWSNGRRDSDRIERSQSHLATETTKLREPLHRLKGHTGAISSLVFSSDSKHIASGSNDGTIDLWHTPRKRIDQEPEPAGWVKLRSPIDMALSPDGRTLATGMRLHKFPGHTDWVGFSTWSPNGHYVASASHDGTIRIWKVGDRDEQEPQILEQGDCFATGVSFSPDGRYIATCGTNGKVMVWASQKDESGWNLQHTLEGHRGYVLSVLISPDSKQILSSGADKTIRIWDIDSGDTVNKDSPIKTELRIDKMWFDKHSSSHVMTPHGAKSLVSSSSEPSQVPSWSPY
ncbi:ribosome assembly protein 4 (RSA4), partial [Metarhizium majus ARSEF 297]